MLCARPMARFTGNPPEGMLRIELVAGSRSGRMAVKAAFDLGGLLKSAQSLVQGLRSASVLSGSDSERLRFYKETQVTLIELPIFLINIGLPHVTATKCPLQVGGN